MSRNPDFFNDWDDLPAEFFTATAITPATPLPPRSATADTSWPPPSAPTAHAGSLPEFSGRADGIFSPPPRAPLHPSRPPSLALRPRPLRETQAGSFLRAIAAADAEIWAAQESGVRFWNLREAFGDGGARGRVRRGDEESAPFWESCRTAPALCLAVDRGRGVVWSGHRDGHILGWRTESRGPPLPNSSVDRSGDFKECLAWNAHRAPVLSMIVTPYGARAGPSTPTKTTANSGTRARTHTHTLSSSPSGVFRALRSDGCDDSIAFDLVVMMRFGPLDRENRYCVAVNVIGFLYAGFQVCWQVIQMKKGKPVIGRPAGDYFDFAMDQLGLRGEEGVLRLR